MLLLCGSPAGAVGRRRGRSLGATVPHPGWVELSSVSAFGLERHAPFRELVHVPE